MKHLPNLLTCLNLLTGCLGILALTNGRYEHTAYYIWIACLFDFFDGFAARLLRVSSPIGKDLDSLADVVSFGVLPSLFMVHWMTSLGAAPWVAYSAPLIAICSALRLAVFNNDSRQSDSFRGLPTPANALFLTGLPFVTARLPGWDEPALLAVVSLIFSILLISRFELFALKFKTFGWRDNQLRYTFLFLALFLLATLQLTALSPIIILYISLSFGSSVFSR